MILKELETLPLGACTLWLKVFGYCLTSKGFYEKAAAVECYEGDAEELRRLPQTQKLAVVAAVHQGNTT